MIWNTIVFTKLRSLEPFRQSYIWMSAKILESQFPPVLVCSTAAYIIASISIFPRGFSMGTTEGERGLGGRTTHQEKLRMSLVNVKLGVQKQVNKGKTPRKPNTPKKRGNLIKQSMCSMWSEEGIERLLVIFNNKDKHKVQRQRERRDSRKALLLCFDLIVWGDGLAY